jgi:hypothetical protein
MLFVFELDNLDLDIESDVYPILIGEILRWYELQE